ncbi:MAG: ABC transporter permease [Spirochaetia bacterium]
MKFSLKFFMILTFIFLFIPIFYILVYSLSLNWQSGILPQEFSVDFYRQISFDSRFYAAILRSVFISGLSTSLVIFVVLFALYGAIRYDLIQIHILEKTSFIISIFPPIVLSTGVINAFIRSPLAMTSTAFGSFILLTGLYILLPMSFIFRIIINSLKIKEIRETLYVSEVLGSSPLMVFFRVFIPSVKTGLMLCAPFAFNFVMGEIIYLKLLTNSRYETLMVYIDKMRKGNPGQASAMTVVFYLLIFFISYIFLHYASKNYQKKRNVR